MVSPTVWITSWAPTFRFSLRKNTRFIPYAQALFSLSLRKQKQQLCHEETRSIFRRPMRPFILQYSQARRCHPRKGSRGANGTTSAICQ